MYEPWQLPSLVAGTGTPSSQVPGWVQVMLPRHSVSWRQREPASWGSAKPLVVDGLMWVLPQLKAPLAESPEFAPAAKTFAQHGCAGSCQISQSGLQEQ